MSHEPHLPEFSLLPKLGITLTPAEIHAASLAESQATALAGAAISKASPAQDPSQQAAAFNLALNKLLTRIHDRKINPPPQPKPSLYIDLMRAAIRTGEQAHWDKALEQMIEATLADANPLPKLTTKLLTLSGAIELSSIPPASAHAFLLRLESERQLSAHPDAWAMPRDCDFQFGPDRDTFKGASDAWRSIELSASLAAPQRRMGI